jgi:predicted amidohydrolase
MTGAVRVAAMQLRAHDRRDFPDSLDRAVEALREAASRADLVVLPEGTLPAYVIGTSALETTAIGAALDRLRAIATATRTVIVVGTAVATEGRLRNAAVVIDADGSIAGRAEKLFLWHFDRRWFEPGTRIEPIATAVGALGVLICADGRIPTIARALVDRGAGALIMPTAWVTSGRDPDALENVQADLLARVRAYENRVPFVAANKCGSELGMIAYCGKSQVVDARGEIVAMAGERTEETLHASISLARERPARSASAPPLAPSGGGDHQTLRLAISYDPLPTDIDERLDLLDDAYALSPHDDARMRLAERAVGGASVADDLVLDPAGLVAYQRAGYRLICWNTRLGAPWAQRLARARAIELRMYLVVFDGSTRRAFAVDPDGSILAGTFDGYRLGSFSFDPRKTTETTVAPGSEIGEGLDRVTTALRETLP